MRPRVIHALLCPKPSRMQSPRLKNYAAAWKVVSYGSHPLAPPKEDET